MERPMDRRPALLTALIAPVVAAALAAGPAIGQDASIIGYDAMFVASLPDQTPGHDGGAMQLVDKTTVMSLNPQTLVVRHSSLLTHADQTLYRRAASDVTMPLAGITIDHPAGGIVFRCNDGSNCISWRHVDWYAEDNADYGPSGVVPQYSVSMTDQNASRLLAAVCSYTHCD
jgi:hypothetical protein